MKTRVSSPKIFNVVLCVIILLTFVLIIGSKTDAEVLTDQGSEVIPLSREINLKYKNLTIPIVLLDEDKRDFDFYLKKYDREIKFFSKLFDYNYKDILNDLKERQEENESFEVTNIGYLKNKDKSLKKFPNFEYGLIEYFYELNNSKSKLRKVKYVPYEGGSEYIESLILYYSSIYENVDPVVLLGIGAAESGNYKVKYMLNHNNVYGGMKKKKLIKHNNIEQGVLSFVRLMSRNYYGKGLETLEEIGRVYCPVYIKGVKRASSHWVNLVTNRSEKYKTHTNTITIEDIYNIEEI